MSSEPHVPNVHEDALRAYGLGYPGATEDFPWGHRALKVKGKTFAWLISDAVNGFGMTVKLPESGDAALMMPFAQPAGYGLAKAGWVDCKFRQDETPPVELLKKWLDESYRAVAPAKLLKELEKGKAGGPSQIAHTRVATMKTPKRSKLSAIKPSRKKHGDKLGAATKKAAAGAPKKRRLAGVAQKLKAKVKAVRRKR